MRNGQPKKGLRLRVKAERADRLIRAAHSAQLGKDPLTRK